MQIRWLSLVSLVLLLIPVKIAAQNTPPVANAGPDQTEWISAYTVLEGSAYDPDSNPIAEWLWTVEISPPGSSPFISDPNIPNPAFRADVEGDYVLSLKVSDSMAWSEPDSVTVRVYALFPPVAIATADPTSGPAPLTVQFDASESYAAGELTLLYYDWVFDDASIPSNEISPIHTYEWAGNYTAVLRIQDGLGQTALATVDIIVIFPMDIQCPRDTTITPFSASPSFVLFGFQITNASDRDRQSCYFDYELTIEGPAILDDNGDPASLSGMTPLVYHGESYIPPEAALEIYEIHEPAQVFVTYHVTPYGYPGGDSCTTVITIEPPGYTPPGTDVVVHPVDATTGTTPVKLTFENVTEGGTTELTTGDAGPPPPGGFKLVNPTTYFDLTTTATYAGMIEVCIDYSNLSPGNENQLKLFHYEDGHWVQLDVTIDIDANVICANVSSLSPFAIFEEISGFGLDIHPRSCPNPFNITWLENIDNGKGNDNAKPNKGGVMPAAIVGSADFDVTEVDVSTLLLGGVSPIRHSFEDVATSASGEEACECTTAGPDGIMDLCLKFERQEIAAVMGPGEKGDVIELTITGTLLDGTPFEASDCVTIVGNRDDLPSFASGDEVVLKPAVPNPFNPITRISYYIPSDEFVNLSIFDVTGKLVQTLVAKHQAAGDYIIEWNAGEMPSGVYFYRLVAGDFVKTKKMVLLK